MYINITDETGQLTPELMAQTRGLLEYAAGYIHLADSKEMAVTFVDNARSHALNLRYRDTDRATDVISLEYKPDKISFDGLDGFDDDLPDDLLAELDPFIGELYISVDKAREQATDYGHSLAREYGFLAVHGFLHINGYDHYTPADEAAMFGLQEEILSSYGLTRQ